VSGDPKEKKSVRQMSAAARQSVKDELDKWKKEKEDRKL